MANTYTDSRDCSTTVDKSPMKTVAKWFSFLLRSVKISCIRMESLSDVFSSLVPSSTDVSYSLVESSTDVSYSLVPSSTDVPYSLVESSLDESYSFVDTSEWIPCDEGFAWNEELGECEPVMEPRSFRSCPWGYKMSPRFKQCIRVKYNGKQQWGTIRKWWHKVWNPPVPRRPPPRRYTTQATTVYTGKWYGYNLGYGQGVKRP